MTRKETLLYFILGVINIISGVADIDWMKQHG
jgi:hypothetical protein